MLFQIVSSSTMICSLRSTAATAIGFDRNVSKSIPAVNCSSIVINSLNEAGLEADPESDLNHLRANGISKSGDGYDVFSIAKQWNGDFFDSYRSLERMASAAFFYAVVTRSQANPGTVALSEMLANVRSDNSADHNPLELPMFLVAGRARELDRRILSMRLEALGAELCHP
jgi:hypothetical protein